MNKKISIEELKRTEDLFDSEAKDEQMSKNNTTREDDLKKTPKNQKANKEENKTPVAFSKKTKKRRIRRYIIISLLLIVLGAVGYFAWVSYGVMKNIFVGQSSGPNLLGLLENKQLEGESSGRVNILLLGTGDAGHPGSTLTDTIMVVSIDMSTKKVAMISIPRDLYVKIDKYGYSKINAANSYGESNNYPGGGVELARETVSKVLGIPIHYYVKVNFSGFKDIIDAIGGVDINVEKDLYDPYYPTDDDKRLTVLNIKKGQQHMDGALALKYARSRETTSDFDRAKRQQQVLIAVKEKLLSTETLLNVKKILELMQILGDNIKTDFATDDFQRLIELAKLIDTANAINLVFDNSVDGYLVSQSSAETGYILIPRLGIGEYDDIQAKVGNIFSEAGIENEKLTIIVQNGTTRTGLALRTKDSLTSLGYNVIGAKSADSTAYAKTKIYDFSSINDSVTVKGLERIFNVISEKGTGTSESDIVIILGSDFEEE